MNIIHTSDWHLGQLFYDYERTHEHHTFLEWLEAQIANYQADVLLLSGDVFDVANPSSGSLRMFYAFLTRVVRHNPGLQVVVTAGNHDSAARLESPKPLLDGTPIHIVGTVSQTPDGQIDFARLLVPLANRAGQQQLWCLAVPFLRLPDVAPLAQGEDRYRAGVQAFYAQAYAFAQAREGNFPVLAMGHLHSLGAEITDDDAPERLIMGGAELVPASAFPPELVYLALGHIHKAQQVGGGAAWYSGSPLPMSFAERNYRHSVLLVTIDEGKPVEIQRLAVPRAVEFLRVPEHHKPLPDVLAALYDLPAHEGQPRDTLPYLEVRVLLDAPGPALRHRIHTALEGKAVRLARVDVRYPSAKDAEATALPPVTLGELKPADLFASVYRASFQNEVPDALWPLFREAEFGVRHEE